MEGERDVGVKAQLSQNGGVLRCRDGVRDPARRRGGVRGQDGSVPKLGTGRDFVQALDDARGGGKVVEAEVRAAAGASAHNGDAVERRRGPRDCTRVDERTGEHRPVGGRHSQRAGAVGREQRDIAPADAHPHGVDRGVPGIEARRRQPGDFAEQQPPVAGGSPPGGIDVRERDEGARAFAEQGSDGRRGTQHIDDDETTASAVERFGRKESELNAAEHPRSMPQAVANRTCVVCSRSMDVRPVGIFDSGVGGLSVLRYLRRLAPRERLIYFADTAYFPYGPRPSAEVRKRSFAIANRLLGSDVKLIVVACNTASAAAVADLREAFPVPFVGMVPGVKPAASASRSGRVAILATPGTLDGELFARVVEDFGRGTAIATVSGDGLADIVERGESGTDSARAAVREALASEVAAGADTVVLGCTHYHFLAGDIAAEFPGLAIVDTSEAVARRVVQVLDEHNLAAPESAEGGIDLIVSGDRDAFRRSMEGLGFVAEETGVAG